MGRDPFEGIERPAGCPYDDVCQRCPQSNDDDVCFPHERRRYERMLARRAKEEAQERERQQ